MEKYLNLSVHQLVDFLLRSGDIDNRVFNRSTMQEGTRLHSYYQSKQNGDYIPEYLLEHTFFLDNEIRITLQGRADGVYVNHNGLLCIDEIKTTTLPLDDFFDNNQQWHLGQAQCYAYMLGLDKHLREVGVRLSYIRQGKEKEKRFHEYVFTMEELEQFVYSLFDQYLDFYSVIFRHIEKRNLSIKDLPFPFKDYRKGQRELAKYCYAIAKKGGRLYCEAPTGIGKTISTLYPFIRALELDEKGKVFYLTAKSSGKEAAYKTVEILKNHGLVAKDIVITAKEKICFDTKKQCNPDECPYAKGYYSKIQGILLYSLLNHDSFSRDQISEIARENYVCPFELQLDLSLFCDVIVCDYNYLFDPISYMKRYFDEDASHFLVLVDEAHNLTERSKEMYSSSILESKYLDAKKSLKHCKNQKIKRLQTKINKFYQSLETLEEGYTILEELPDNLTSLCNSIINAFQDVSQEDNKALTNDFIDYYLDVNRFMKIYELFDDKYVLYYEKKNKLVDIHLFCQDASIFIDGCLEKNKGAVLFSATLEPFDYYVETLGGNKDHPRILLPSPFDKNNFKLIVAPKVSIKYKNRNQSLETVVEYIKAFIKNKVGNYFIYSPSYEYMDKLLKAFEDEDSEIHSQKKEMSEKDKEDFLANFQENPTKNHLGFLVLGGAFGEGIDLVSDRLIGAVIIGIGMPKINFRSDKIAEYYNEKEMSGYNFAYLYPGMNKVMQAVGRVIRTETDRGAALLIDERYMNRQYRDLFKAEWNNYEVALSPKEVSDSLLKFFKK
ncbi:MAG: helicase C-terminal domain-containing protein [Bacilli bacterium]|nr:helicase C-terminal domain-containing protein [Bacilli bacterium]